MEVSNMIPEPIKANDISTNNNLYHPIEDYSTAENLQAISIPPEIPVEKFTIPRRNSIRHDSVSEISILSKQTKPNRLLGQHALSSMANNNNNNNDNKQLLYQRFENRRRNSTGDFSQKANNQNIIINHRSRRMTWSQNSEYISQYTQDSYDIQNMINNYKLLLQNRYTQITESKDYIKENQDMNDQLQLFELFQKLCPNKMPSLQYLNGFYTHYPDILVEESDTNILKECIEASKIRLISEGTKQRLSQYFQGKTYPSDIQEWITTRIQKQSNIRICHRENHTKSSMNFRIQTNTVTIVPETNPNDYIYTSTNNAMSFMLSTRPLGESAMESNVYVSEMMQKIKVELLKTTSDQKLMDIITNASKAVNAYGMSSFGGIEISQETGRLSVVSCGNIRVLILRRSPVTGMFNRVVEMPISSASSGINNTLQNWPSYQEILNNQSAYSKEVLMHALMYHVAYTGPRDPSSFLVEQIVQSQEGDFVLIADQAFFDIVSGEEIRHLVSCTLSPTEEKDVLEFDDKSKNIPSMLNSILLHRISSVKSYINTIQSKNNNIYQTHPKCAYTQPSYPLNINIISGWVTPISE